MKSKIATIRGLCSLLRSGRVFSTELVSEAIAAAKAKAELNAFLTIIESQALAEAAERDRELRNGHDRGPFHGIPIALKDLFYTRGVKTTAGSKVFENFVPDFDADVVTRLRAAGAISIGKTNLHELAFGITSRNPHFGPVLNPLDQTRLAGGSSGGSAAAVAAGIVPMALGTDTGGSIRIPASFCGIVGLKPTYGRISRKGVLPLAFSLDHVGPLASCVEDCALAYRTMADVASPPDTQSPETNLRGLRVGVPREFFFERLDDAVASSLEAALSLIETAGADVTQVTLPDFEEINLASRVVQLAEFASLHVGRNDPQQFGADVWALLEQGRMIAGHEYVNAQRLRTLFRNSMDQVWQKIDVLVTPTTPITAPDATTSTVVLGGIEETVRMASTRFVRGINLIGEPALSLPCGRSASGMPASLQLIAAPFAEHKLLQIGRSLERMLEG